MESRTPTAGQTTARVMRNLIQSPLRLSVATRISRHLMRSFLGAETSTLFSVSFSSLTIASDIYYSIHQARSSGRWERLSILEKSFLIGYLTIILSAVHTIFNFDNSRLSEGVQTSIGALMLGTMAAIIDILTDEYPLIADANSQDTFTIPPRVLTNITNLLDTKKSLERRNPSEDEENQEDNKENQPPSLASNALSRRN